MVCFDTDFLIAFLRNDHEAINKLEDLMIKHNTTATTTLVNAAELWKGVYHSKDKQKEISKVKWLLDSLELLTLDYESARIVGELDANAKKNPIGESDLLIASIAIVNKQTLITRNKKHFAKIPDLQVEIW
jgi:tRNA(fMet)-specific endonuclease VapC